LVWIEYTKVSLEYITGIVNRSIIANGNNLLCRRPFNKLLQSIALSSKKSQFDLLAIVNIQMFEVQATKNNVHAVVCNSIEAHQMQ